MAQAIGPKVLENSKAKQLFNEFALSSSSPSLYSDKSEKHAQVMLKGKRIAGPCTLLLFSAKGALEAGDFNHAVSEEKPLN